MWKHLRARQLGFKFRRQHPIGPYFADIICKIKRLIIEIDGGQHNEELDRKRTDYLEKQGYRILRFWNNDVLGNIEGVMAEIVRSLDSLPSPPRKRGGAAPRPLAEDSVSLPTLAEDIISTHLLTEDTISTHLLTEDAIPSHLLAENPISSPPLAGGIEGGIAPPAKEEERRT